MIRRLLLITVAAVSLLLAAVLPGPATMPGIDGSAHGWLGVADANDSEPTPTPAPAPPLPDGGCQGGSHCGG